MSFETAPSIVSLTTAADVRFSSFGINVGLVSFSSNRLGYYEGPDCDTPCILYLVLVSFLFRQWVLGLYEGGGQKTTAAKWTFAGKLVPGQQRASIVELLAVITLSGHTAFITNVPEH